MTSENLLYSETTGHVIGAFYEVYNTLGPGFFERIYADAMEIELLDRGRKVQREFPLPVFYKRRRISNQRVDMLVDGAVLVEIKSTAVLPSDADRQINNYLRASPLCVGFLLHFGLKPHFYRRIHTDKHFMS